jgi:hypothetical protein
MCLYAVFSPHRYSFAAATGHYSQMMWAKTSRLGCGVTAYRAGRFNARLYVCNYGEGGNVINLPVYRIGAPCDDCRGACSRDYPALCTAAATAGPAGGVIELPTSGIPPLLPPLNNNNNNASPAANFGPPSAPAAAPAHEEDCHSLVCMINKPVKMMGDAAMNTVDFVTRPVNTFVGFVGRPFGLRPFQFPSAFRFTG